MEKAPKSIDNSLQRIRVSYLRVLPVLQIMLSKKAKLMYWNFRNRYVTLENMRFHNANN